MSEKVIPLSYVPETAFLPGMEHGKVNVHGLVEFAENLDERAVFYWIREAGGEERAELRRRATVAANEMLGRLPREVSDHARLRLDARRLSALAGMLYALDLCGAPEKS